jgi:hypothetical protein
MEELAIVQPQLEEQQLQEDTQIVQNQMETQEIQDLPEEKLVGISAWAARTLLKTAKPVAKEVREKIRLTPKIKVEDTLPPKTKELEQIKKDDIIQDETTLDISQAATDISNADLKQFKTTDSHQVNFDTIEGGDDVAATIAQMADLNKLEIDEARRGVITDELLTGLANDLGQDPTFIKKIMEREQGELFNAEHILASRQMIEQSAMNLKGLADKINASQATEQERMTFAKQWQFHKEFTSQFMGMRAEFGRGLRSFGVDMGGMDKAKINEVMSMVSNDMSIDKVATQIATMDSTKGINQVIQAQDSIWKKGTKVFVENFISSILSGAKTQIVNTSGSALRLGMDIPDTITASVMGAFRGNNKDKVMADEALAKIFGMQNGFLDALKTGWQVAKTTEPYGGIDKLDMLHEKAITSKYLNLDKESVAGKMVDTYGSIVRAPLERVMGGTDAFWKVISERSSLASIAYREVASSGLEGAEAMARLQKLMENPNSQMIEEMEGHALDVTFQKPLGETGQAFQKVVNSNPALKVFVPFIKTPTNLMKQAFFERTPLAMLTDKYKQDVAAGGARADMARAKMVNGSMMGVTATSLAMSGKITGSNPKDNKARQARHDSGWRPRSIVLDNEDGTKEYISYDRMEPFSYIFGFVADLTEWQSQAAYDMPDEETDKHIEDLVTGLTVAFAENTVDKTFMTGVKSIMETLSDPKRYGKQYIANMANAQIPFAGLRRDLAKLNDDVKKETSTILEKIQAASPYYNKDLPPKLNAYGEIVKYDAVLNPWTNVSQTKDKVKLEVQRLAESTRAVAVTLPSNRIEGVKLSSQQYHDLKEYARKDLVINGMNFHETLSDVMKSEMYLDSPSDDMKVEIINSITKSFDMAAKEWLKSEDGGLSEKIQAKKELKLKKLLGDK